MGLPPCKAPLLSLHREGTSAPALPEYRDRALVTLGRTTQMQVQGKGEDPLEG